MPTRVLVVDDDAQIRKILKDIIVANGMEVAGEAVNGIEAVIKFEKVKPDVIFMDIMMPLMNGIEASKLILMKDPSAKIVVCSALGEDSTVQQAIDAGVKDYFTKPFKAEDVIQAVRWVLVTHR